MVVAKKVLVTGACGFIGSHLVDKLVELEYDVVATDLAEPHDYFLNKRDFKRFLNPKAMFIPADLSIEKEAMTFFDKEEMQGVETVFHLAAVFNFFKNFDFVFNNNVRCTQSVCEGLTRTSFNPKRRLIMFSSGVVNSPILRASSYGTSKFGQEIFLNNFLKEHNNIFEGVIVRPAAVFGPRSRYGLDKVIKMLAGGQLQFFIGKKNLPASVIYVDDVVDAVIHLAEVPMKKLKKATGGVDVPVFDLESNDLIYTYEELMEEAVYILRESHDVRIIPIHMPVWIMKIIAGWQEFLARRLGRQPKATIDSLDFFRARMTMNIAPAKEAGVWFKINTLAAMKHTINWYREGGWI